MQYGAIACATASAAMFTSWTLIKDEIKFEKDKYVNKKEKLKKGIVIGGGIVGLMSIFCGLKAIEYKFKSGEHLQLYGNKIAIQF